MSAAPRSAASRVCGPVLQVLITLALAATAAAQPRPDEPSHRPVKVVADQAITVTTPAGQGVLPLYVSRDWRQPQPDVTRAVLVIHGILRNADVYWRSAQKAAEAGGPAAATAIMIVPQFLADQDIGGRDLPPDRLHWHQDDWMGGAPADGPASLSSFDALDAIIARLEDRRLFPHLQEIVVAGHSGGAQVVQRYAVLGRPSSTPGLVLRYVVANPSSYAYFDAQRPGPTADCPNFNTWKYGLQDLPPYSPGIAPGALESRYVARRVTYLLGQDDTNPNHPVLDKSCAGEAEGPYRLARGARVFCLSAGPPSAGIDAECNGGARRRA